MATTIENKLFCIEKLEKDIFEINGDDEISAKKVRRITVDGFGCFIQYVRRQGERDKIINDKLNAIHEETKKQNTFKFWFVNKVLPSLFSWSIIGVVTYFILWWNDVSIHIGRINP